MESRALADVGPDAIVLALLEYFAEHHEALARFLDVTGLSLDAFRATATSGSLQTGLFDYLLRDESLLVALASRMGVRPETVISTLSDRLQDWQAT